MYEIFAYWNADDIRAILNAVALTMNGPGYLGLMKALAIGALLVSVGTAMARMKGEEPIAYFLMLALFYGTMFVPKTTVAITDVRAAKNYTVANVPLGLAFFASTTSHIGHWLTDTYETNFTSVDDLKFSASGMAFGARMGFELQRVKIQSPGLRNDLISFTANCINPELIDNNPGISTIMTSTNVWQTVGGSGGGFSLNPGRSTPVDAVAQSCTDAYNSLTTKIDAETTAQLGSLAKQMNPSNAQANTIIMSQIPAVEAMMFNVARTAQDSIKQSMVANMLSDAQPTIAAMNGNPQSVQMNMAVSTAEQSSIVSYGAMAKVAESALPKLRNAIELLILGLFPVVFLLVIMAGVKAGLVIKSYLMGMFWVQLWAPIYAIINYMATKNDAEQFKAVIGSLGPNMTNMGRVADTALSASSMAGLLTISVPVIALAIVKGGEMAMSSAVSQIMAPAQGAAQKSGDAIGQGNLSAGNVSWGNTSSNNWSSGGFSSGVWNFDSTSGNSYNTSMRQTDPGMSTYTGSNGVQTRDGAGNLTGVAANKWDTGGNVNGKTSDGRRNSSESSESVRAAQNWGAALERSSGSTMTQSSNSMFMRALSDSVNGTTTNGSRYAQNWSSGSGNTSETAKGGSSTLSNQEASNFNTNFGASGATKGSGEPAKEGTGATNAKAAQAEGGAGNAVSKPGSNGIKDAIVNGNGGGINAGAGFGTSNTQALLDQAFSRNGNSNAKQQQYAASVLSDHAKQIAATHGDQSVRQAAQSFSQDLQNAVRATQSSGATLSKGSDASQSKQDSVGNEAGGSMQSGRPVFDQLMSMQGGSRANRNDVNAALGMANSATGHELTAATQAAAAQYKAAEGQGWKGQGGATGPRTMGSVESQGKAAIQAQVGSGAGAVAGHNASSVAQVGSHQAVSPTSSPDRSSVDKNFSAGAGAAYSSYAGGKSAAQVSGGADIAAAAIYAANQGTFGTQVANTFFSGAGYEGQTVTASNLKYAASVDPAVANELEGIQKTGVATEAQRQFLMKAVSRTVIPSSK